MGMMVVELYYSYSVLVFYFSLAFAISKKHPRLIGRNFVTPVCAEHKRLQIVWSMGDCNWEEIATVGTYGLEGIIFIMNHYLVAITASKLGISLKFSA